MKDIVISASRLRTELKWLVLSFVIGLGMNIYSIIKYDSLWKELITSLHIVLLVSVIVYLLLIVIRGLAGLLLKLVRIF